MRLVKIRLKNYRRFQGEHTLDLNESVVALVGANEAGKSSLLQAIDLLGRKAAIPVSDVTRGSEEPASISGLYVLDVEDRRALEGVHQGPDISQFWLEVSSDANRAVLRPLPVPSRSRQPRRKCLELTEERSFNALLDELEGGTETASGMLADVRRLLSSDTDTLSSEAIQQLEAFASSVEELAEFEEEDEEDEEDSEAAPEDSEGEGDEDSSVHSTLRDSLREIAAAFAALVAAEREPSPGKQVIPLLDKRLPQVEWFTEKDRSLESSYTLAEVADDPPPALANLCKVAGVDLAAVQEDITAGRVPRVEKVFEDANKRLKTKFRATWTQSTVYPRLSTPSDGVLRVLVATEGEENYSFPEERSDGLRWFMALHSFLVVRDQHQPILLVDEAETHLHYDAQADLVSALMRQRVASKVVYTTHSVGCLPPDLGTGIRAVLGDSNAERSCLANSYWSVRPEDADRIGYAPLLFAMGARFLALTIPSYGVVVEGPSDAILLPTLLRQASGLQTLPYRIVPGLSELAKVRISAIDRQAGRVACITDGDKAGEELRNTLVEGGFPPDRILDLGRVKPECQLEDLLAPDVLAAAVNAEISTWGLGEHRVVTGEMPATGRWEWMKNRAVDVGLDFEKLSKVRVAQRVVEQSLEEKSETVEPDCVEGLRVLHTALLSALGLGS